jgi:hypothetical protein
MIDRTDNRHLMLPCPVCHGTKRICVNDLPPDQRRFATEYYSYSTEDNSINCANCGGQTMMATPTGLVRPRRDNGQACKHEYQGTQIGHCYWRYTCTHCGDEHCIDSGD